MAEASATGKITSLLDVTVSPSGGVAAGLLVSGGVGVALLCASAKHSLLLPEVFDDCSYVGRRRSPRDRVIIRELNESVFPVNCFETDSIGCSESFEKVGYSILSRDLALPTHHRLHSVTSDFRTPSVTEFGEAALRRLVASRVIGGDSSVSDDPAP